LQQQQQQLQQQQQKQEHCVGIAARQEYVCANVAAAFAISKFPMPCKGSRNCTANNSQSMEMAKILNQQKRKKKRGKTCSFSSLQS